ncbi:tail fiber domain-containing protein [Enterobacter soli]|uniref:tail fiber domain-containing protein n=1 Tax=Enterobacter soli TaxID=885040 RepID=UPI002F410A9A
MIYTTGTIAISGNTLTGTGTNFTAAGSLIRNGCTVIALTSPAQVFQITAIGGSTSLTVTPAASPAIPAGTKYSILLSDSLSVDGLAQDIAETFTMYQRYMSGFADVMNGTTDVTITINGVAVTVPGQKSLAKKGANSDITSLSGLTTALSVGQGGTGAKTKEDARTNLGAAPLDSPNFTGTMVVPNAVWWRTGAAYDVIKSTAAGRFVIGVAGNDAFQFDANGFYTAGNVTSNNRIDALNSYRSRRGTGGAAGSNYWNFYWDSALVAYVDSSNVGTVQMQSTSDRLLKKEIEYVTEADSSLTEVLAWRPATFKYIARGVVPESETKLGFIANDLVEISPECVDGEGLQEGYDPLNPVSPYTLDQIAMIAKLTQAVHSLAARVIELEAKQQPVNL